MKRNLLFACKLITDHVRSRKIRPKLKPPISHSLLTSTNTSSPGASPSVCFIAASYLPSLPRFFFPPCMYAIYVFPPADYYPIVVLLV